MLNVTGLGAECELASWRSGFDVVEFVDLDDGRRITWREELGFSGSTSRGTQTRLRLTNGRELAREVLLVLDPDGDVHCTNDDYVITALKRLQQLGHDVDRVSVYAAPFRVEFGPRLREELARQIGQRLGGPSVEDSSGA